MTTATPDGTTARLQAIERKLDALSDSAAVGSSIAARLDRLEAMIDTLGTLGQRMPVIADGAAATATWAWGQAEARGIDPIATGQRAAELALVAADPEMLALLERLAAKRGALSAAVDALDAIDEEDLTTVAAHGAQMTGTLAALLRAPEGTEIEPVGPFRALRKLGDIDVKRALGFGLALAKRVGQLLAP